MFISKSYGNLISGIFTYKNYMYMLKSYLIIELHVHILQCQRAEVKIKQHHTSLVHIPTLYQGEKHLNHCLSLANNYKKTYRHWLNQKL